MRKKLQQFTDQTGFTFQLDSRPKRIVSLVPSQTELLYTLGLEEKVVGITKFCIHPEHWFRRKTRIGGTKGIHTEKIFSLQPDLVIANKEENLQAEVELLRTRVPVWTSDINTLDTALEMIQQVGQLAGEIEKAATLIQQIKTVFAQLKPASHPARVAYLIWKKPYMTVGSDSFISDMLKTCGFTPAFDHLQRYPEISEADLQAAAPEFVFLSSEPYPFKEKDIAELQLLLPASRILLVDGELFSWYGSRLQYAPEYFQQLIDQLGANP
ncbi:helical backbone metal receptor [Flavihumibacter cheonanensis]|uniref:ABC transporter substrate-binding protein n=1 Tax=Flavihumibacter cheonanensis TaxID=1442385 RepID=UPI001EF8E0CB|nr:helical backbone metal receptor [Flavihumibacter cheonanensis]MCG7752458.1 helical backbone metal receptor [Flavihumibacter cheonanensis]